VTVFIIPTVHAGDGGHGLAAVFTGNSIIDYLFSTIFGFT
jgi:hypothetical protein